ncbi:MAG: hypothetical protein C0473_02790 [Cyanobacteria bacterium DS3.002]|jgi:hypothetical protein|nr:hypothetical protein [Cyanobacteria bacterium DS3.002]
MKVVTECRFQPEPENDLYLSRVEPSWRGTVINKALSQYLSQQAMIDIADGKGVVSFWRKLDSDKKAEVLRRLGTEGEHSEKADPELWKIVTATESSDFFVMAAKYLTLHQIKHGRPWQANKEITGAKTRKLRQPKTRGKHSDGTS